jgi:hypothetical protein
MEKVQFREMTPDDVALEDAHKDAVFYGAGWLRVDSEGHLTRVNPICVHVTELPELKA